MPRIHDVSRPIPAGVPVWPGDASCRLEWTMRLDAGQTVNVAELCFSAHTGTHADGPYHVNDAGARIGEVPLEPYLGPARVVDARGREALDLELVEPLLDAADPVRLLFRTGAWTDPDRFPERFPAFTPQAAAVLAEAGVPLVGTDAPSVDPFTSRELLAHHALGRGGVAILENLLLDHVAPGTYELIALPLLLPHADASPVRAVLREL